MEHKSSAAAAHPSWQTSKALDRPAKQTSETRSNRANVGGANAVVQPAQSDRRVFVQCEQRQRDTDMQAQALAQARLLLQVHKSTVFREEGGRIKRCVMQYSQAKAQQLNPVSTNAATQ